MFLYFLVLVVFLLLVGGCFIVFVGLVLMLGFIFFFLNFNLRDCLVYVGYYNVMDLFVYYNNDFVNVVYRWCR